MNFIRTVEDIRIEDNKIVINGYAFIVNKDSINNKISIFLRNLESQDEIWLKVKQTDRLDVNNFFSNIYEYKNSGFIATTDVKKIKSDESYEIIICIDNYYKSENKVEGKIRETVSTNRFIFNEKLYSYNPAEFKKPNDTKSTFLNNIFNNGKLCFYQKDEDMFVYQYNGKLYWIASENFNTEEDGYTYIIFHLYTTQTYQLPEKRIQYKFDNLDFFFENNEYTKEVTTPYRVAICDIPVDYAITYLRTGVYDNLNNKSIWYKEFHIDNKIY